MFITMYCISKTWTINFFWSIYGFICKLAIPSLKEMNFFSLGARKDIAGKRNLLQQMPDTGILFISLRCDRSDFCSDLQRPSLQTAHANVLMNKLLQEPHGTDIHFLFTAGRFITLKLACREWGLRVLHSDIMDLRWPEVIAGQTVKQ